MVLAARAWSVAVALVGCAQAPAPQPLTPRDVAATDAPVDAASPRDVALDLPAVDAPIAADVPAAPTCGASVSPLTSRVSQVVLVIVPTWGATRGDLLRYERTPGGRWTPVGARVAVAMGRAGLGWGRGLHGQGAPAGCEGPGKSEGDGRSPAGVFALGAVYGDRAGAGAFAYTVTTPTWRCPDDPASAHYNEVLDGASVTPDWNSAEAMVRADGLYRWVVFVEHNTAPRVPRGGSCIFLHVWAGASSTTAGCTSMERAALEEILAWMRPGEAVQVALPAPVYATVRGPWGLP